MKRIGMMLSLALMLPVAAWAEDIVATWQYEDKNTMKMAMRDENRIRMDTGEDNYILLSGKKVYMVSREDGQWRVMDMDQMAAMMNRFGFQPGAAGQETDDTQTTFRDTGRTETVAGFKGSVYVVETKDKTGKLIDSSEIVFSKHKDVVRINKAWMTFALRMGTILGGDTSAAVDRATKEAEVAGYGGVLRVEEMKLVGIEKPSLSAAHYELPKDAVPMDMGAAVPVQPQQAAGQAPAPAAASDAKEDPTFVKDLGKEAGDAAQDEVKQNTIDEVRKGVGGLFKKVFK